ncbi:hypothetical protein P691DRAFT_851158 [Macrolepiota fuliginosa MF-IS2]|uniref:Uncharacterized protein n=1 Tax=Macrolepiota fuliginosa MF-IS2 TaxID=1400762 RepID=A0A9P6C2P0_9AGAR|nr:hypothetical protein P691DRAFT_851158 [Macrolepiota fuliginosa MF-IS2]
MRPRSLPVLTTTPVSTVHSEDILSFPLKICSDPTSYTQIKLRAIVLTSPVHIHAPEMHIGAFYGGLTGQSIGALDIFFWLQSVAKKPVDFYASFSQSPPELKAGIKTAFMLRCGHTSHTAETWETFISGKCPDGGPLGYDLLLGNNEIWGFEGVSLAAAKEPAISAKLRRFKVDRRLLGPQVPRSLNLCPFSEIEEKGDDPNQSWYMCGFLAIKIKLVMC